MFIEDDLFYKETINLYQDAGHIITCTPQYINHTYQQVIYFDSEIATLIDPTGLNVLEQASNISHLFDLGADLFNNEKGTSISYYSIVLGCEKNNRSQTAHDIHFLLHSTFTSSLSIIAFKHEDNIMLSVAGFDNDIILSNWYQYSGEYDDLSERIHIAQLSLDSPYEFIADLVYIIARDYYRHPVLEKTEVYNLIPPYYFLPEHYIEDIYDREPIKELIKQSTLEYQQLYGDDYVEPISEHIRDLDDVDAELDMLSFELDLEEELSYNIDDDNDDEFEEDKHDEYEYENVDKRIFEDPNLMLKWLDEEF